jgi:hypothetical protein
MPVEIWKAPEQIKGRGRVWFRDVDSNHDTQLQRLMSYRLDDPGSVANITFNIMPQPLPEGQLGQTQQFSCRI